MEGNRWFSFLYPGPTFTLVFNRLKQEESRSGNRGVGKEEREQRNGNSKKEQKKMVKRKGNRKKGTEKRNREKGTEKR